MARLTANRRDEDVGAAAPLKLALVSPYDFPYPGGVTEHIANLAAQFRGMGHEVHIIAPSSADEATVDAIPYLHRIGRVVPIPASGSVARIALTLRGYRQVKQLLAKEQFDLIHLHEPLMPALPLTVLRHSQTANVGTFHAYRRSNLMYLYGRPVLRPFFRKLHGRIAVSRAARSFVSEYFPGDFRVIPNGIDYEQFAAAACKIAKLDDGKLNVLYVGRLEKRKGLSYLLRAWPRVHAAVKHARLVVVGEGRPLESYRRWTQHHGDLDITFEGYVPREELVRYYQSCDVFCAPSTGQESFGIVLLEAMAAGRPIVTTEIPGYMEVVSDGVQGLLVPPKDVERLGDALIRALREPSLRAHLGQAGRVTARQFAWERVAVQVAEYYVEVLRQFRADPQARQSGTTEPSFANAAELPLVP
jgi:phosphatidylinositol alpha-mannosyltransferase